MAVALLIIYRLIPDLLLSFGFFYKRLKNWPFLELLKSPRVALTHNLKFKKVAGFATMNEPTISINSLR